jgi:hypothetical protein
VYQVLREFSPASKCLLETKVDTIQMVKNNLWKITYCSSSGSSCSSYSTELYAVNVCLATGGKQLVSWKVNKDHYNQFYYNNNYYLINIYYIIYLFICHENPKNFTNSQMSKVVTSDEFCTEKEIKSTKSKLQVDINIF